MVEALQAATIQAGLDEAEFWRSTPYQSVLRIKAAQKGRLEMAWLNERLAREELLNPLAHYTDEKAAEVVDMASAMRDWAKRNDEKFKVGGA